MPRTSPRRCSWPRSGRCGLPPRSGRSGRTCWSPPALAGYWRRTLGRQLSRIDDNYAEPERVEDGPASDAPQRAAVVLAGLSTQYARILQLRFLDGCSVKHTAAEMGVSVANAMVLQHRALRRAAQLYQQEEQR